MQRAPLTLATVLGIGAIIASHAQDAPSEPGSPKDSNDQFEFMHAWIEKSRVIRDNRERFIRDRGFYQRDLLRTTDLPRFAVTGTLAVPTFCVKFSNSGADPYPVSILQTKLYDGPFSPRTLTEYYREISYGALNLTGTVYGWTTLPEPDTYYAGFNPSTTIRYRIGSREHVELRVYDVSGALVRTLVDGVKNVGAHTLEWNGRDDAGQTVSSGVYFYRLVAGDFSDVRKMTLVR